MLVTGATNNSRLAELKKYAVGVPFNQQYFGGGSPTVDGVVFPNTSDDLSIITYYIGGIRFVDTTGVTTGTTFSYTPQGTNSPDFLNEHYYKDPNKENIISNPKINDDVFIIRQQLTAFDSNYRLEYIKTLVDLTTYAGGKFFNIVNNT